MLVIPIFACATLGAIVGYLYRFRPRPRRIITLGIVIVVFMLAEILSGTWSGRESLNQNLLAQLDLFWPFVILYLLPAFFTSFLVARGWLRWWT